MTLIYLLCCSCLSILLLDFVYIRIRIRIYATQATCSSEIYAVVCYNVDFQVHQVQTGNNNLLIEKGPLKLVAPAVLIAKVAHSLHGIGLKKIKLYQPHCLDYQYQYQCYTAIDCCMHNPYHCMASLPHDLFWIWDSIKKRKLYLTLPNPPQLFHQAHACIMRNLQSSVCIPRDKNLNQIHFLRQFIMNLIHVVFVFYVSSL